MSAASSLTQRCESCGAALKHRGRRYCSRTCFGAWMRTHLAPTYRRVVGVGPSVCGECGERFTPGKSAPDARWCSPRCYDRHHRRFDPAERARRNGRKTVLALRATVLERQGWVCGICARPIPRDVDRHDDLALTIDHVVPIAQGGQHTLPNLQPAHRACNVAKGDATPVWWSRAAA